MAGIKQIFAKTENEQKEDKQDKPKKAEKHNLSDEELRKLLKNELIQAGRFQRGTTFRQGDMSRFFINLLATALLYTFTF